MLTNMDNWITCMVFWMDLCSRNRRLLGVEEQFAPAEKGRRVEMSWVLAVG
jgi:hypothetical protein